MNNIEYYIDNTRKFWKLKNKSLFHNTISLITSQKIRFIQSRKIREKLYILNNNEDEYSIDIFSKLVYDDFEKCGIEDNIIKCILLVINLEKNNNLTIDNLLNIKNVGPWTIKALKIMNNLDNNVLLYEDYWIRQRVSELFKKNYIVSQKECKELLLKYNNLANLSSLSNFFWRIKKSGIVNILNNQELTSLDFL